MTVRSLLRKGWGLFLVGLGYWLSPLSWWNDLFFNLPIAYGVGYSVAWLDNRLFLPATIMGYWASNVLGILMMQWGAMAVLRKPDNASGRQLWPSIAASSLYTLVIIGLAHFHILTLPEFHH